MRKYNPIIVALDHEDPDQIVTWARLLGNHAGVLKIGLEAFSAGGPALVKEVAKYGPVFLDLKLHDIPNTVARAVKVCNNMGVSMLTVHASGGASMMQAAAKLATNIRLLGVTVLTSHDEQTMVETGQQPVQQQVQNLAKLALTNGAHGVVCAPSDLPTVRAITAERILLVVPGIRPHGADNDDQKRVATPQQALQAGATHLVIGRPITQAPRPANVLQQLYDELMFL